MKRCHRPRRSLIKHNSWSHWPSCTAAPGGVSPTLGTDWNGESAVFFQVILADNSVPRAQFIAFTKQSSQVIVQQIVWVYI